MGNTRICARQSTVIRETSAGTSQRVREQLTKRTRTPHEESSESPGRISGSSVAYSSDSIRVRVTSVLRIVGTLSLYDYD